MPIKLNSCEILVSFGLLQASKVSKDIDLLINHMNKIDNNIDIINKLIYKEKRDFTYIAKWLRMPIKTFIKSTNKYIKLTNDQRN